MKLIKLLLVLLFMVAMTRQALNEEADAAIKAAIKAAVIDGL